MREPSLKAEWLLPLQGLISMQYIVIPTIFDSPDSNITANIRTASSLRILLERSLVVHEDHLWGYVCYILISTKFSWSSFQKTGDHRRFLGPWVRFHLLRRDTSVYSSQLSASIGDSLITRVPNCQCSLAIFLPNKLGCRHGTVRHKFSQLL